MKTLFLVRHAKSSWKDAGLSDWQRPLNKRGKSDAPGMGKRLARAGVKIDKVISSSAVRAVRTAELLCAEIKCAEKIDVREELYNAAPGEILEVIRTIDADVVSAMIIAHNPGITDLVNRLSNEHIDNVPTCGVVRLRYDIKSWNDIGRVPPTEYQFDYPKNEKPS